MSKKQPDLFDFKPSAKILVFPPSRFAAYIRREAAGLIAGGLNPDEVKRRRKVNHLDVVDTLTKRYSQPRAVAVAAADDFLTAIEAEIVRQRLHGSPASAPKAG